MGTSPAVMDVIAVKGLDDPNRPDQLSVVFSSKPDLCNTLVEARSGPPAAIASLSLLIVVLTPSDQSGAVAPGTYSFGNETLDGMYETFDSNCQVVAPNTTITAGTAQVTGIDSSVRGSFDVMFGADDVTGTFDAPLCAVPVPDAGEGEGGTRCLQ
jgi:hypothetical protein